MWQRGSDHKAEPAQSAVTSGRALAGSSLQNEFSYMCSLSPNSGCNEAPVNIFGITWGMQTPPYRQLPRTNAHFRVALLGAKASGRTLLISNQRSFCSKAAGLYMKMLGVAGAVLRLGHEGWLRFQEQFRTHSW